MGYPPDPLEMSPGQELVRGRIELEERELTPTQRNLISAFKNEVSIAMAMDTQLARWAEDYGFSRAPGEAGSLFLGRFCLYLSQMFLGMRGNPTEIARMCTCHLSSDLSDDHPDMRDKHEYPCILSAEARRRQAAARVC